MDQKGIKIHPSWYKVLKDEFEKPYFKDIKAHLVKEFEAEHIVYPPGNLIFNAFDTTPFNKVKVVILGQDPYHGPEQAMGLSFSVPKHVKIPASLKRIYKEMHEDVGIDIPTHGDLTSWAEQGVFLLNAMLTVRAKSPGSHSKIGWQDFTNAVISKLSTEREKLVFLLWGNFAKSKKDLIDEKKHYVLQSAHPSPLAGNRFFGHHHFSNANKYLEEQGIGEIDWGTRE